MIFMEKLSRNLIPVLLVLFISLTANAQGLTPTETEAVLELVITDNQGNGVMESFELVSKKTQQKYTGKSDSKGIGQIKLPINQTYVLNLPLEPEYGEVEISNTPLLVKRLNINYDKQERTSGLEVIFTYTDFNNKPLANEPVWIVSKRTNQEYRAITGADGVAKITNAPKDDTYIVSVNFDTACYEFTPPAEARKHTQRINYTNIGTVEYKRREAEKKKALEARERRWRADSLARVAQMKKEAIENERAWKTDSADFVKLCNKIPNLPPEHITKALNSFRKLPMWFRRLVVEDRNTDTIIPAVLRRNKNWTRKLLVVDVTGSMTNYYAQIYRWLIFSAVQEPPLHVVFVNGGAGREIYHCDRCDIDALSTVFFTAINDGGSREFDLRGIIEGINLAKNDYTDIILVGDNFEPIEDLHRLHEIKNPVHVLISGLTSEFGAGWIREDFLNLALKSKGTLHTLTEDINNLAQTQEGKEVSIGGKRYRLNNGKFVWLGDDM